MSRWLRVAGIGTILATIGLTSCSVLASPEESSVQELSEMRELTISTAKEVIPAFAAAFGVTAPTTATLDDGGLGPNDMPSGVRVAYTVKAEIPALTASREELNEALEDLGFTVDSKATPGPCGSEGVHDNGLTLATCTDDWGQGEVTRIYLTAPELFLVSDEADKPEADDLFDVNTPLPLN